MLNTFMNSSYKDGRKLTTEEIVGLLIALLLGIHLLLQLFFLFSNSHSPFVFFFLQLDNTPQTSPLPGLASS
jgi:hypothetical protein